MGSRVMKLRRADVCRVCARALPAQASAYWDQASRTVTCLGCLDGGSTKATRRPARALAAASDALDRGSAGASARREYQRRRGNREAGVRRRHPLLGGLLLALAGSPRHETAWARGARGEESVARGLERRTANGPAAILHDRRMPGGYGNIDHLAVAPRGVFVIDAKAIRGKVRVSRPWVGGPKLLVRGRARAHLVNGLERQVAAVRDALARIGRDEVPVHGAFCFTSADLPLLGSSEIRGLRLCHGRGLARRLNADGALTRPEIDELARELARIFLPA